MNVKTLAATIKPLPPTAVRILVIMLMNPGASFSGKYLAKLLSVSENTISSNIEQLAFDGLAQYNGRQVGWSLSTQLPLEFPALHGEISNEAPASHGGQQLIPTAAVPALQGERPLVVDNSVDNSEKLIQNDLDLADLPASQGANRQKLIQKNLDQVPVNPKKFGSTLSHARVFSSSSSDHLEKREQEEERKTREEIQKNLDQAEIRRLLIQAGIGSRSSKLDEILALDLDLAYVQAHVAAVTEAGEPVSFLITRLLDGDPVLPAAPVDGCERHGRAGWIADGFGDFHCFYCEVSRT